MARSIAGLFADRASAEQAITDLKSAGFDPAHIGVVMQDRQETQDFAAEHGTASTEGAVAGGLIGGTAGALLAATGALVIPGIGPFITGGILASLIGGAAGWLVGGLAGLGIPKDEAEYYETRVQQGSILVTVDAQGRDAEARQILLRDGAENLQAGGPGGYEGTMTPAMDTTTTTTAATTLPAAATTTTDQDIRVPVLEEELVAGKRQEEIGRVRLHKDVIEEQQTVPVTLEREQVYVERVPVAGQGDASAVSNAFVEQDIDVPVMGEQAVVAKQVRGVEEVRLHKDTVTEQQQVGDTVRKERVYVEGVDEESGSTYGPGTSAPGGTLNTSGQ